MSGTVQEFSYEADSNGNVYERDAGDGSVWPTGIRVRAWATRNDITRDECDDYWMAIENGVDPKTWRPA